VNKADFCQDLDAHVAERSVVLRGVMRRCGRSVPDSAAMKSVLEFITAGLRGGIHRPKSGVANAQRSIHRSDGEANQQPSECVRVTAMGDIRDWLNCGVAE